MVMQRADEMVAAGSAPIQKGPFQAMHSRHSLLVLVDLAVISYFIYVLSGHWATQSIIGLIIWSSYRSRTPWSYNAAIAILALAALFFAGFAAANLYYFAVGMDVMSLLFAFLMGWASWSSIRHIRIHLHPIYRASFINGKMQHAPLHTTEILAGCPSCMAVLAIDPLQLSPSDKCPHCDEPLVTRETAARFGLDSEE
jgi:hypothetical protein